MPDYKQEEGSATTWRRASTITITNPLSGTPGIWFQEDDVAVVGDKQFISNAVSHIQANFNQTSMIPLIDPSTGLSMGTSVSQGELQVILYSLYIQLADLRDNPPPAPPVLNPVPVSEPTPTPSAV